MMANPTRKPIRNDAGGLGHYGAPRSKVEGGKVIRYKHQGTDYQCDVGQDVLAPCTGVVLAISKPYRGSEYSGIILEGKRAKVIIWYLEPEKNIVGKMVMLGQKIGVAQDISKKYVGVTPHIHVQIDRCDPELLIHDTPT